jgi:transcription initiation factor TFIID subunit 8
MDRFLFHVRTAMTAGRRATPTAQDFIHALAHTSPSSAALLPHVQLDLPAEITQPPLAANPPDILSVPQMDSILGDDLSGAAEAQRRVWIPRHLPALPSRHAWQETPVFSTRETDALKIREKATEGGVQAEKSLRRLAKAEKAGVTRLQEHIRKCPRLEKSTSLWEKAMGVIKEDDETTKRREEEGGSMSFGFGLDSTQDKSNPKTREIMEDNLDTEDGARVNWETRYWRRNAAAAAFRA